ncbi:hypothetical protein [Nocardiopsis metallicus]|uniref:Uncharacterized protein n=1 Tax=Nocardiopsis metallicus TaxID=179819 RepID=A0A840W0F4_9ACTN|nr:hypothetical protein [Nocardiopsis metallicus]MBB5490219.1 hypothetical protein [Nocardiopsis metallicus]
MSPKKRNRRKPQQGTPRPAPGAEHQGDPPQAGRLEPGQTPKKRPVSRTPVALTEPPDRRVTVLWVTLWVLWALGSPLALTALLFTALNAFEMAADPAIMEPGAMVDPALLAEQQAEAVRAIGTALVWFLIMAWLVPAVGAVTAAVLRRKMAAIAFTVALALSVGLLLLVVPPVELWEALSAHLLGTVAPAPD